MSSTANGSASNHFSAENVQPMYMVNQNQLGEPDITNINKQDLLSAISFDNTGKILSVGDRGGRIICF